MVKIIFVDHEHDEIEMHNINMRIEEALKVLPNLEYRVGADGIHYNKTGLIIVDIEGKTIEIQLDFPADR